MICDLLCLCSGYIYVFSNLHCIFLTQLVISRSSVSPGIFVYGFYYYYFIILA